LVHRHAQGGFDQRRNPPARRRARPLSKVPNGTRSTVAPILSIMAGP
jgi:hypothetical protein